jgi:hypothetical protein
MRKTGKKLSLFIAIFLLAVSPVFSDFDIGDLKKGLDGFTEAMAQALPFNSTIGLNWSDAYIGQLLDIPPRFGIGVSAGATFFGMEAINEMTEQFGVDLPADIPIGFPLPGYTVDARIGGFLGIPFDIGLKFGYLDTSGIEMLDSLGVGIEYMLLGFDFRYALLDSKILPIKVSVGAGFNHLRGGVSAGFSMGTMGGFSFSDGTNDYTISITGDPEMGLFWQTNVIELKAHVSFPLFVITPYFGAGLSYSWSRVGYRVDSNITIQDGGFDLVGLPDFIKDILDDLGIDILEDMSGFESVVNVNDWNLRLYGGLSLNLFIIRLDITAMYNLRDSGIGATVGLRLQL